MSRLPKPPTLSDVARLAGVSVPTASRALNGGVRGVRSGSPDLQKRVSDAAEALGYVVHPAAQATKDGRSRTVAVLVSDIDDFGSATIISGVMHSAEERGLSVAVRATRDDPRREVDLLRRLRGERHRSVIIATGRTTDVRRETALTAELTALEQHGTRVVVIGDSSLPFAAVTVNNFESAQGLASALVDGGHRRFAIISAPPEEITARDRMAGFLAGLEMRGVDVPTAFCVHRTFSRDGGYAAMTTLEAHVSELDVIAAMSDAMAVGAIARLRSLGLHVPGDVEVTGFDHLALLADVIPEFSTVEVPLERLGEAALGLALDEAPTSSSHIALSATPIVRGVALPTHL